MNAPPPSKCNPTSDLRHKLQPYTGGLYLTYYLSYCSRKHDGDKVMVFERGGLLWAFNFHPTQSYTDYRVGVQIGGKYRMALNTDAKKYDGHGRVDENTDYYTTPGDWDGRQNSVQLYLPSRSGFVLYRDS